MAQPYEEWKLATRGFFLCKNPVKGIGPVDYRADIFAGLSGSEWETDRKTQRQWKSLDSYGPKDPLTKGQGLGRLVCWAILFL